MLLPIGDAPQPVGFRPYVTWALIAINVLVYLTITLPLSAAAPDLSDPAVRDALRQLLHDASPELIARGLGAHISAADVFSFQHGFKPGAPEPSDLFSSLFLHGGLAHLAGNMLFLWIYGDNVEHRVGRVAFLALYLFTGVVATLAFAAFADGSMTPLVGASGAISGVLGLYFVFFPRNEVKLLVFFFPFLFNTIRLPARWVLGFYLVLDNLIPVLFGARSNVAYGAHIGGFVSGVAIAWVAERLLGRRPRSGAPVRAQPTRLGVREPPLLSLGAAERALMNAVHDQDRARALSLADSVPPGHLAGTHPAEALTLAEWRVEAHDPAGATDLLRRVLAHHRAPALDQARVHMLLGALRVEEGRPTAAAQHFLAVFDFDPDERTAARARAGLASLRRS